MKNRSAKNRTMKNQTAPDRTDPNQEEPQGTMDDQQDDYKGGPQDVEVTRVTLAKILDITPKTVMRLTSEGVLKPTKAATRGQTMFYSLFVNVPAYLAFARKVERRQIMGMNGGTEDNPVGDGKSRKEMAAAKLAEMKVAQMEGTLVERQTVINEVGSLIRALATKLRSLPRRFSQVGIMPVSSEGAADDICREFLLDIAGWKEQADTDKVWKKELPDVE